MYTDKAHINLLTALLLHHEIGEAVVCPGSRNAPIVHNLHECRSIRLHPVTDERSAAFVAIGLWLKTRKPIVVCVTSGSALLNTLPGVAEAFIRHIPLIIVSADRPEQWIGQLDGQTLLQKNALQPYACTWHVPEPYDKSQHHYCKRLLNEALLATRRGNGHPVHINLPIEEPLFNFSVNQLPAVVSVREHHPPIDRPLPPSIVKRIQEARLPLLLVGQHECGILRSIVQLRDEHKMLVYADILSQQGDTRVAQYLEQHPIVPDLVVHIGGNLVDKTFKQYLRANSLSVIRISPDEELPDTFLHLEEKVVADTDRALCQLNAILKPLDSVRNIAQKASTATEPWTHPEVEAIFLGNSRSVRLGNRWFSRTDIPVYGNRGTNGIEGTLSAAVGYALAASSKIVCILGDLSFFYDANALWNTQLNGNLRILLLNDGGGGIFQHIAGLSVSPAFDRHIAASHSATAQGIAQSYDCTYRTAHVADLDTEIKHLLSQLLQISSPRPVILETFISKS